MEGMVVLAQLVFLAVEVLWVSEPLMDLGLLSFPLPSPSMERPFPRLAMKSEDVDDGCCGRGEGAKPKAAGALRRRMAMERFMIVVDLLVKY